MPKSRLTHCARGHSMHDAIEYKRPNGVLQRKCRECARARMRDQKPKRKVVGKFRPDASDPDVIRFREELMRRRA